MPPSFWTPTQFQERYHTARTQNHRFCGCSPVDLSESEILTIFCYFWAASAAKNCTKKTVIQSAASAASAKGGCTSSRLDHGLKFYVVPGGCASSRLINGFLDYVPALKECPQRQKSMLSKCILYLTVLRKPEFSDPASFKEAPWTHG